MSTKDCKESLAKYIEEKKTGIISRASDYAKKLEENVELSRIDKIRSMENHFVGANKVIDAANRASAQRVYLETLMLETMEMNAHLFNLVNKFNLLTDKFGVESISSLPHPKESPSLTLSQRLSQGSKSIQQMSIGISRMLAMMDRADQVQERAKQAVEVINSTLEPDIPDDIVESINRLYITDNE